MKIGENDSSTTRSQVAIYSLRRAAYLLPALLGISFASGNTWAANWTGNSDLEWNEASNWDGGIVPNNAGDSAIFNSNDIPALNGKIIDIGADITLGSLDVFGPQSNNVQHTLSFSGTGGITFDSGVVGNAARFNLADHLDLTVGNSITLLSDLILENNNNYGGSFTLNGVVNAGEQTLTVAVQNLASSVIINGTLNGSGSLVKTGLGVLRLSGNNAAFSGVVDFQGGIIEIGSANALGAGSMITLSTGTEKTLRTDGNNYSLNNGLIFGSDVSVLKVDGSGTLSFNNASVGTVLGASSTILEIIGSNTVLAFGQNHRVSGGILVKTGTGTLSLGSTGSTFSGLEIRNGYVTTGSFTGNIVFGNSSGSSIFGTGDVKIIGDSSHGVETGLIINGASGSKVTLKDSLLLVDGGGTLQIINSTLRLEGGTLDFGGIAAGTQKGRIIFGGNAELGNTTLLNTANATISFEKNVSFLTGSTIAADENISHAFIGTGTQALATEQGGDLLTIEGFVIQSGSGTTTVGNIDILTLARGIDITAGTFNLGVDATLETGTSNVRLSGGALAFGKENQYASEIAVSGTASSINFNGYSQTFSGLNLSDNAQLLLSLGVGDVSANLGTVSFGNNAFLKIQDWDSNDTIRVSNTFDTGSVWFYGYNKGASYENGVLTPGDRLTVEWTNNSPGNDWMWGNYLNWVNSADNSVDAFNLPNAPGVTVKIGLKAGNPDQQTINLGGGSWTLGTLIIDTESSSYDIINIRNGTFIFDSGVAGQAAQILQKSSPWGYIYAHLVLKSDLIFENSAYGGHPYIRGGVTSDEGITFIKRGQGNLRIWGTNNNGVISGGLGDTFLGNLRIEEGTVLTYADNILGKGSLIMAGGGISVQYPINKYEINNKVIIENSFAASLLKFTYVGDVLLDANRLSEYTIAVATETTKGGERASLTFDQGFNFVGDAGLVKSGAASMEMLSANSSFRGGLRVTGGALYTTLRSDLLIGDILADANYLGSGNITVTGSTSNLIVATDGYASTLTGKVLTLANGGSMGFTGGGEVRLEGGTFSGGTNTTKGTLTVDGNIVFAGTAITNTPNLTVNSTSNTQIMVDGGVTAITGIGTLNKVGAGVTTIHSDIVYFQAGRINIAGGSLKLGGSDRIDNTTTLRLSGGVLDASDVQETFGILELTATSGILLGDSGKLTFSTLGSGDAWNSLAQLNIQNSGIIVGWDSNSPNFVRLINIDGIDDLGARLGQIAFSGYEVGAEIVKEGDYFYLRPVDVRTTEWLGSGGDNRWGNDLNWLPNTSPNAVNASATIRDLDQNLNGKTIDVDAGYTIGKLNIEATAGQTITFDGEGSLTFNGDESRIRHAGGSTVVITVPVILATNTELQTTVSPANGYLDWRGTISGSGDLTKTGNGTLRISGDNSNMNGRFIWQDISRIQVAGDGAVFGATEFQIGQQGDGGIDKSFYVLESYGESGTWADRSHTVTTAFRLGGNILLEKQTELGVTISDELTGGGNGAGGLEDVVTLTFSGNGIIEEGDHVIHTWGNGTGHFSYRTEWVRLALMGQLTGAGAIIKDGIGTMVLGGVGNDFSGGFTLKLGRVEIKNDQAFGTGVLKIDGGSPTATWISAPSKTEFLTLSNGLYLKGGLRMDGNVFFGRENTDENDPVVSKIEGIFRLRNDNTVIFGEDHILTDASSTLIGSLEKGRRSSYVSVGILRLQGASTYSGGTSMQDGIIEIGRDSVFTDGGSGSFMKNGTLVNGTLVSGAIGVGNLDWNGGNLSAYSKAGSGITSRRLSNRVTLSHNTIGVTKAEGDANKLILDTSEIKLRDGIGDLTLTIASGAILGIESKLIDATATQKGGITKAGAGVLELSHGDNQITDAIRATAGIVRAVSYEYAGDGRTVLSVRTGDVTIGTEVSGQNYFGSGQLVADGGNFEVVTTSGSTVTLATRNDGRDTLLLNNGSTFTVTTNEDNGTGVVTVLGDGLVLRSASGAVGTLSVGNGEIHATNATIGVKLAAGSVLVKEGGTVGFSASELLSGVNSITLTQDATLKVGAYNQTLGGVLIVAGDSTLDFSGNTVRTQFILDDIIEQSGILKIENWRGNPNTGLGLNQIILGENAAKTYARINFGSQYILGAVARFIDGEWILLPMGVSYVWDGRNGSVWDTENWLSWVEDNDDPNGGYYAPTVQIPNSDGVGVRFGDEDSSLDGRNIALPQGGLTLMALSVSNTQGANFSVGNGETITLKGSAPSISMTAESTASLTLNANLQLEEAGADLIINHEGSGLLTLSGAIQGNKNVEKVGTGTLRLSGQSTFTGALIIYDGNVQIAADGTAYAGPLGYGDVSIKGGSLEAFGGDRTLLANHLAIENTLNIVGSNKLIFASEGASSRYVWVNGNQSINVSENAGLVLANAIVDVPAEGRLPGTPGAASGKITKTGNGLLELTGNSSDYAAGIDLTAGKLAVGSSDGSGTNAALGTGTLTFAGNATLTTETMTTSKIAQIANAMMINNGITATVENVNTDTALTLSGKISGGASSAFQKTGLGKVILSNTNTYGGGTNIVSGELEATSSGSLGSGNVSVQGGATGTLSFNGATGFGNAITINTVGSNIGLLNITGTGNQFSGTLNNNGEVIISGGSNTFSGAISGTGTNLISATAISISGNNTGFSGKWDITDTGSVTVVQASNVGNASEINVDGALNINASANFILAGQLSGAGVLNISNSGSSNTFAFSTGAQGGDFSGIVNVNGGTFVLDASAGDANNGVLANATLSLNAGGIADLSGNQAVGALAFSGGTLAVGFNTEKITAESIAIDGVLGGTVDADFTQGDLLSQDDEVTATIATSISGVANIDRLVLKNADTATTVIADIKQGGDNLVARGTYEYSFTDVNNGTNGIYLSRQLTSVDIQDGKTFTLSQTAATSGTQDFKAAITGNSGTGHFEIQAGTNSGDSITLTSQSAYTYTGTTTIATGKVILDDNTSSNIFGNSSAVTVNGELTLNNATQTLNRLSGSGTVKLGSGSAILHNTVASVYGGTIEGASGSITKTGNEKLSFTGNSSGFSGSFAVNEGHFSLASTTAQLGGSITVSDGAVLSGVGTFTGRVDALGGSTIIAGTGSGGGEQLIINNLALYQDVTLSFVNESTIYVQKDFSLNSGFAGGEILMLITGDSLRDELLLMTFDIAQIWDESWFNVADGSDVASDGYFEWRDGGKSLYYIGTPIPEPSAWSLFAGLFTLSAVAALRRRRRPSLSYA